MGKPRRITKGGYFYHVFNRANGKLRIFRKAGDFVAFENILADGLLRFDMRLCGYCIMGNHWHLLLWPKNDGELSEFMHWLGVTHTNRWHTALPAWDIFTKAASKAFRLETIITFFRF